MRAWGCRMTLMSSHTNCKTDISMHLHTSGSETHHRPWDFCGLLTFPKRHVCSGASIGSRSLRGMRLKMLPREGWPSAQTEPQEAIPCENFWIMSAHSHHMTFLTPLMNQNQARHVQIKPKGPCVPLVLTLLPRPLRSTVSRR